MRRDASRHLPLATWSESINFNFTFLEVESSVRRLCHKWDTDTAVEGKSVGSRRATAEQEDNRRLLVNYN